MIEIEHTRGKDVVVVRASGTLTGADYDHAVPEIENAVHLAQGPLHVMIRLEDFHGWEIGALWQELRFDAEHEGGFRADRRSGRDDSRRMSDAPFRTLHEGRDEVLSAGA